VTASLTVVHRRQLTILLPAVAILAASSLGAGCSTVENKDVSARVNDTELSPEELTDLVEVVGAPDPTTGSIDPTNGNSVRGAIQLWVQGEVVSAGLDAAGTPITAAQSDAAMSQLESQLPNLDDLSESTVGTLVTFLAVRDVVGTMADPAAFITEATDDAEVYVDPRFGEFLPADLTVIPLGLPSIDVPAGGVPDTATG
jgi:hypothetical protein